MPATRYREVEVSGTCREMGQQLGEAARDEVRGFCEVALERVNKTIAVSTERAYGIAEQSLEFAERYASDLVDELRGTAEAAGVSLLDLMLLQVRNQLQPDGDAGCTSLALADSNCWAQGGVVAQNWDNDPALDEFTIVLTRRPVDQPHFMTVTQAGLIAYIGLNDRGLGACLNTLPAPSRPVGVPHYFTLRRVYEADCLQGAIDGIESAERAVPANFMLITPDAGPVDLEVTVDAVKVIRGETGSLAHTNHCLHTDLLTINDDFPELIESHPRKRRIDELTASSTSDRESVMDALRDHDAYPRSICRHANDTPVTGFWQTVFSVVIEAGLGRMHVSRGTPCDHPYEPYSLTA